MLNNYFWMLLKHASMHDTIWYCILKSAHQLEDYNEISEIADITSSGCSLEMVASM
jgi:protein TIF31